MKTLLIALAVSLLGFSAQAADPRATVIDQDITELSRLLQTRLPTLAVDGMLEAERQARGWNFEIRVRSEGDWGVIFSWWDRLHGTFRYLAKPPPIGLPGGP